MPYGFGDTCPISRFKHVKDIVACDQVMVFVAFDCADGTNLDSPVKDPILKSHFLDIDEKGFENVNKGGRKVNKHVELWRKNTFDDWKVFYGFDTSKSIVDLLENESSMKDLVDMLSFLILQVAKKDSNLYPPMS
jgi:hypothetical protein